MISKELLSEILGVKVTEVLTSKTTNFLYYMCLDHHNLGENTENSINIYELAYKCKEWAIHKSYHLHSSLRHHKLRGLSKLVIGDDIEYFEAETEPESIFLACQWILENKDNK